MKTFSAILMLITTLLISTVNGSVFLTYMKKYLTTPRMDTLKELVIWQLGGVIFPLFAGPMRVIAFGLWNLEDLNDKPISEMLQARLFLNYGITNLDSFSGYWMDFLVYKIIYPMAKLDAGFVAIDFVEFFGEDIICYNLYGGCDSESIPGQPCRVPENELDTYD